MSEPQDAVPKWMDPNAQDDVPRPQYTDTQRAVRHEVDRWQSEADMAQQRRRETEEYYARADPETLALRELVDAERADAVAYRQLHATRAAAWASLAVLRELRAHHRPR